MPGDQSKGAGGSSQQEDTEFQLWWKGQENLKKNIQEICARYGEQVNVGIHPFWFIYIKKANLLNCYISKVICIKISYPERCNNNFVLDFILLLLRYFNSF